MAGAIIFVLGGALQAAAQNVGFLLSGRFIAGLGAGILGEFQTRRCGH